MPSQSIHWPQKRPSGSSGEQTPVSKKYKDSASPEAIQRPTNLHVGALIEALDVQELWYPARVEEIAGRNIRVSFAGWSSEWDEWLPKSSPRIREHRGWGTAQKPRDWQVDSTIEALDLMGKWYKARVLHVSETAVMVHYNAWSSKWNEWVERTSGRLRRLDANSERGDGHRKETHEDVCALCEEPGSLICCDSRCKRAFHVGCCPPNNPPPSADDDSRWICSCLLYTSPSPRDS